MNPVRSLRPLRFLNRVYELDAVKPQRSDKYYVFLLFLLPFCFPLSAQEEIKQIKITRFESLEFAEHISADAMRVLGNVQFTHDDVIMTCDSAYFYETSNTLDAFSNVHITKIDGSVNVYGDLAKYQGNIKFAEIWENVLLEDEDATLKTRHLYYDMNTNIAYYVVGAEIFNKGNDMVSLLGYYHRNTNMFYFKKDVVLNTPDYTIVTDTLDYNVHTKVADFVGPTYVQNESDTIYCERGWYNTNDTVALFRQEAWIKSGSTTVFADTLFYESLTGNGRAFSNIEIVDTTNNIILTGHKGEYNNLTERAWLTDQAILIMVGEKDSLFLHADTLRSDVDTAGFKIMKAYYKVRFFSLDMQGKCDSLAMSLQDSIIHMFREPILWAQENQMTADHIEIETENQNPKRMNMINKGFIISQEDSSGFNQVKGKKIVALFREGNELYKVNVYDDGQSLYYVKDGPDIIGFNRADGKKIVIDMVDKKADVITVLEPTDAMLVPPNEFVQNELELTGFNWQIGLRPVDKYDIFSRDDDGDAAIEQKDENVSGEVLPLAPDEKETPQDAENKDSTEQSDENEDSIDPSTLSGQDMTTSRHVD